MGILFSRPRLKRFMGGLATLPNRWVTRQTGGCPKRPDSRPSRSSVQVTAPGVRGVTWQDLPVRHSLAGRAESPMQARILARLRDDGPLSKVQLADRLAVSRTTIAVEVGRLGELGLAQDAGPAASRGGRRSTMVDLAADIRFLGVAVGATGLSVGVTDGRLGLLAVHERACDVRSGPEPVLATVLEVAREVLAEAGVERP